MRLTRGDHLVDQHPVIVNRGVAGEETGQESRSRRKIDKLPYCRPGDGRDPLLRFSELSSNGNDLPTIIRSCRGGLDPGLRRGDD
jgi:hypothetical protein